MGNLEKGMAVVAVKGGIIRDGAVSEEKDGKYKVSGAWFTHGELRETPVAKTPSQYFKLLKNVTVRIMDDVADLMDEYLEPDEKGDKSIIFEGARPSVTYDGKQVRVESVHLLRNEENVRIRIDGGIEFTLTSAHDTADALSVYWAVFKIMECNA